MTVALRKESVDRNPHSVTEAQARAVALRKESVDRNRQALADVLVKVRRSPQGERG